MIILTMQRETLESCKTRKLPQELRKLICIWSWRKTTITEIKTVISRSNALKRAATEKQNLLDSSVKKRYLLIEKKDEL